MVNNSRETIQDILKKYNLSNCQDEARILPFENNDIVKDSLQLNIFEVEVDFGAINFVDEINEISKQSISDAYIKSLFNLGRVDIEYIANNSNEMKGRVLLALKGQIFLDPSLWDERSMYEGWVSKEEYLSGNLYKKYEEASKMNQKYFGFLKRI